MVPAKQHSIQFSIIISLLAGICFLILLALVPLANPEPEKNRKSSALEPKLPAENNIYNSL